MSVLWMMLAAALGSGCGGGDSEVSAQPLNRQASPRLMIAQELAAAIESGSAHEVAAQVPAIAAERDSLAITESSSTTHDTPEVAALGQKPLPSRPPSITRLTITLPEAAVTSAGVYDKQGRLLRTLWRGEKFSAGATTRSWDGADDKEVQQPAGSYELRVIRHQVSYIWEGVVGNSSGRFEGATVHKAFLPPASLAAIGDRMHYAVGYNEGQSGLHGFRLTDPQSNQRLVNLIDPFMAATLVAADSQRIYWANTGGLSPQTFVAAYNSASGDAYRFAQGKKLCLNKFPGSDTCYPAQSYTSVIDHGADANSAPTGLAVQAHGRLLAVAHGGLGVVRLFDKTSGELVRSLQLPLAAKASNQIAMSPSGDLWVISGREVLRYTRLDSDTPLRAVVATGFVKPLAIAVSPVDDNAVWVADGGGSQQLKRLNAEGLQTAVIGQVGGYAQGPEVSARKLCFLGVDGAERTAVAVSNDRAIWVVDTCNNRMLRLTEAGANDAQVAYLPAVYASAVDMGNPHRVFANYLEFEVDYSKPLAPGQGWTLRRNWLAGLPAALKDAQSANWSFGGFRSVATLRNGRTYGLLSAHGAQHVVELPAAGPARLVRTLAATAAGASTPVLYEDGDLGWASTANGVQTVWRQKLAGFDSVGNPQWASGASKLAAVPTTPGTAHYRGSFSGVQGPRFPVTATGKVIFFDPSASGNVGFHLGAAELAGNEWSWNSSPTAVLDGKGSFQARPVDATITYAGNAVWANQRHVLYGYHGEFYSDKQTRQVGQANQFMHFFDNGLFVGQFGTPSTRNAGEAAAGLSGNAFSPTLVRVGQTLYLYHNDESAHGGVHRWRIDGANDVVESKSIIVKGSNAWAY